eukprot:TRINITY_DN24882_c0_g1_i1.p1 TRINITY_DN24882_c0_g1~~TRINITY_DN24882_c0_g1_i1.p1  ORF type:complete len:517 (+),score=131.96 TRINITY_DN24882_c0_g1_i1:64-1551(+)
MDGAGTGAAEGAHPPQQPPAAAGAAAPPQRGEAAQPTCRICWDKGGELFAPCRCAGTLRWVHPQCLARWQRNAPDARSCPCCGQAYQFTPASSSGRVRSYAAACVDEAGRWVFALAGHVTAGAVMTAAGQQLFQRLVSAQFGLLLIAPFLSRRDLGHTLAISGLLGWPSPAWSKVVRGSKQAGMEPLHRRLAALHVGAASSATCAFGVLVDWGVHMYLGALFGIEQTARVEHYPLPFVTELEDLQPVVAKSAGFQAVRAAGWYVYPGRIASVLHTVATPRVHNVLWQEVERSAARVGSAFTAITRESDWELRGLPPRALRAAQGVSAFPRALAGELGRWLVAIVLFAVPTCAAVEAEERALQCYAPRAPAERPWLAGAEHVLRTLGASAVAGYAYHFIALGTTLVHRHFFPDTELPLQSFIFVDGTANLSAAQHAYHTGIGMVDRCVPPPGGFAVQALPTSIEGMMDELRRSARRVRNDVAVTRELRGTVAGTAD